MFIAETPDYESIGFLHLQETRDFFTNAPNCHVSDLAVAPGREGSGVGGRLLAAAEDWARGHGCRYITLGVFPANERARRLYERHGFGVDLLRMAKAVE